MATKKKAAPSEPYEKKVDNDGSRMSDQEQLSALKVTRALKDDAGRSLSDDEAIKVWKRKVIQRLKDDGFTKESAYLQKNWGDDGTLGDDDAFYDVWTGKVAGKDPDSAYDDYTYGTDKHNPSSKYLAGAMLGTDRKGNRVKGQQNLMSDVSYWPITSVQRLHAFGGMQSPNALTDNYAVYDKKNHLVRVEDAHGNVHYMPSDDTNSGSDFKKSDNNGEMSAHANGLFQGNVGMSDVGALDSKNAGWLSNREWDEIGEYGYKNPNGTLPNNYEELEAARKARGIDDPPPLKSDFSASGGPLLLYGRWDVLHGADARNVGYANSESVHEAGGFMQLGSSTTFVGDGLLPLSRVGDGTSDGQTAVTGGGDLFIGGAPTSRPGPAPSTGK